MTNTESAPLEYILRPETSREKWLGGEYSELAKLDKAAGQERLKGKRNK